MVIHGNVNDFNNFKIFLYLIFHKFVLIHNQKAIIKK